jgi:hypothetical protein
MRPFGNVTKEDIKKEVDAVIAICNTGGHDNIIKIYGQGTLPLHDYCYVDMEFCDMNLEDYIHSVGKPDFDGTQYSTLTEQRKKWNILTQIARGLNFLHKGHYVHRDLKPRNSNTLISLLTILVLFNQETKLWKLTDFGIMCQATSKNMITTENGRGTQGYRAPELMSSVTGFTNKVDIWALGCILYELMTGTKAFETDWCVRDYYVSDSVLEITVPGLSTTFQTHLSAVTDELLQRDYKKRPSASRLRWLFSSYFMATTLSVAAKGRTRDIPLPVYQTWKDTVGGCETLYEFGSRFVQYFKSTGDCDCAIIACVLVIAQGSSVGEKLADELDDLYTIKGNKNTAIAGWRRFTEMFPLQEWPHQHLTAACQSKGGDVLAREIWRQLCLTQPNNTVFKTRYSECIARMYLVEGKLDWAIILQGRLASQNLKERRYMVELTNTIRKGYRSYKERAAAWENQVDRYPWIPYFQDMLSKAAIEHLKQPDLIVDMWERLVEKYPQQQTLHDRLSSACKLTGCSQEAIDVWEGLVDRAAAHVEIEFFWPLKQSVQEKGDPNEAILLWKRRVAKQPGMELWLRELRLAEQSNLSSVDEMSLQ